MSYKFKKNIFYLIIILIFTVIFTSTNKNNKKINEIIFKELSANDYSSYENKNDEECYREVLKNDSITRPDSTSRDIIDPIILDNKVIYGDYKNLPVSYLDSSIMGCIKNVGSRSISLFDINNDGYLDIFRAPNLIMYNNKNLSFDIEEIDLIVQEKITNFEKSILPDYISRAGNPLFIDLNNDGDIELLVGTEGYKSEYLFKVYQNINNKWVNVSDKMGYKLNKKTTTAVSSISSIDYNNDGFEDLLIGWNQMTHMPEINRRMGFPNKGMVLLENKKGNGFIDVTDISNIGVEINRIMTDNLHLGIRGKFNYPIVFPHQILSIDLDDNGWQDIIIAGDYGTGMLLRNFDGNFKADDNKMFKGESLMGIAINDINNDSIYDIFITQIKGNGLFTWLCEGGRLCNDNFDKGNKLFISDGNGNYIDKAKEYGVISGGWGWGSIFADFNNDGSKELLMAAGFRHGHSPEFLGWGYRDDSPQLWEFNKEKNKYISILANSGLDIRKPTAAVAVGDLNMDGLLDIVLTEQGVKLPRIFINHSKVRGNYININPITVSEKYNKGISAEIIISYNDKKDKYNSSIANFSHMSTGDNNVWFGVGKAEYIDIEINYKDGSNKKFYNIKTNQNWRPS